MLTQSHYASKKFVRCRDRAAYRVHMCGLCHALGDDYGLPYRMLTTHDTILLNLLTTAQQPDAQPVIMRRCPMNPLRHVPTHQNTASTFAAAISVRLAKVSVQDDIDDGDGRGLIGRLAALMLNRPEHTAAERLNALGFDASPIDTLPQAQTHAERAPNGNPAAPTAHAAAALFTATAHTAGIPANGPQLAVVGGHYGTYMYLADAYRDLADDLRKGAFNPLRAFVDGLALNGDGQQWLRAQLETARDGMASAIAGVQLHRDADTVRYLLLKPLDELIVTLGGETHFPKTSCKGSCAVNHASVDGKPKRKRKNSDKLKNSQAEDSIPVAATSSASCCDRRGNCCCSCGCCDTDCCCGCDCCEINCFGVDNDGCCCDYDCCEFNCIEADCSVCDGDGCGCDGCCQCDSCCCDCD